MDRRKYSGLRAVLLCATAVFYAAGSSASPKPAEPITNPNLADSSTSETHTRAHFTPWKGPVGPGRTLSWQEVIWKPLGPVNGFVPLYSGPYPDGSRVVWVGGYDRIAKLDAETLDVLTTHGVGDSLFFTDEETTRHVDRMDGMDHLDRLSYVFEVTDESYRQLPSFYRLLTRQNELYVPYRYRDGSLALRVYGEVDSRDPRSSIVLRREWKIPEAVSKAMIFGMTLTNDGWLALVTTDGKLLLLSQDFKTHHVLALPRREADQQQKGMFDAFLRNSVVVDENNGIYVVTRDYMHRVQWTGAKLSLEEKDGSWTVGYPNALGIGSGTTPALMGWGPDEDHLVVIADGSKGNNMLAFWRDNIPDDWTGIAGMDRRVAGITPVTFGADNESPQIENSIVVHGYGAFLDNFTTTPEDLPDQGNYTKQALAGAYLTNVPGYEPLGGTMIRWDPVARKLQTAWTTRTNFAMSICTVSAATDILYCWGARNGEWTLEGVEWNTGKEAFHYVLGKSQRYNPFGAPIMVAPNGAIDCGCQGGLGMVRVKPEDSAAK